MRIIAHFQFKSEKCLEELMVVVWPHLLEIKVSFKVTRWIWILKLPNNKFLNIMNIKMFINCILFVGIDCIWGSRSQRKVWKTWSFATQSKISGARNQLAPRTSVKISKGVHPLSMSLFFTPLHPAPFFLLFLPKPLIGES